MTGWPAIRQNCLGKTEPKRLPVPAATRMAAMRMGVALLDGEEEDKR